MRKEGSKKDTQSLRTRRESEGGEMERERDGEQKNDECVIITI